MKRIAIVFALATLVVSAQKVDRGTRFEKLDATGSTFSKPFRSVSANPTGSCVNSDEATINQTTGVVSTCTAGTWQALPGNGGGGLADLPGAGIAVKKSDGSTINRQIIGTAGRTIVTNQDGNAGNFSVDTYPNPTGQVILREFMLGADDGTALVDTNDQKSIFSNNYGFPVHVVKIGCETDAGTATITLQRNDGSPANIPSANLVCSTSGVSTTTFATGEDALADGMKVDLVVVTAATSGTPHRISVYARLTVD